MAFDNIFLQHITSIRLSNYYTSLFILGLQPHDKAAMLGVKTKEYFLEEFT